MWGFKIIRTIVLHISFHSDSFCLGSEIKKSQNNFITSSSKCAYFSLTFLNVPKENHLSLFKATQSPTTCTSIYSRCNYCVEGKSLMKACTVCFPRRWDKILNHMLCNKKRSGSVDCLLSISLLAFLLFVFNQDTNSGEVVYELMCCRFLPQA